MDRRPLAAAGGALLMVLTGCGPRGYERAAHDPGAPNFQPGYPPGYLAAATAEPPRHETPRSADGSDAPPPGVAAAAPAPAMSPPVEVAPPPPRLPASTESPPHRVALAPTLDPSEPARRIASLSPAACRAEVKARDLPVALHGEETVGVATPMRLTGPLRGVRFVTHPAPSPYGLMDCRMVLALDELADVLARFGVVKVRVDNVYRKGARINGRGRPSQHSHALAADVTTLERSDGRTVAIEGNWGAPIGAIPCGPDAVIDGATEDTPWLRDLVCTVAQRGIFHHILTPSADRAHHNHLHLDIQRDAKNRFVR